jgi:hypothetical protein
MLAKREGLLGQIEAGVLDNTVPMSSLLQNCISLGGQAGSEKMRDWARQELHGYTGSDSVPDYRHLPAALIIIDTNGAGYNGRTQRITDSVFPEPIRDRLRAELGDLEDAVFGGSIGDLEAMASKDRDFHHIIPYWSSLIADTLNMINTAQNSRWPRCTGRCPMYRSEALSSGSAPPWSRWSPN